MGGTVLQRLVHSNHPLLTKHTISVLVRGPDRAAKLQQAYGDRVSPILYQTLDDLDLITKVASQHNIVVNTGTGFHPASADALVRGLSKGHQERSKGEGAGAGRPWMIHTSGGTNSSDNPLGGDDQPDRWFHDADPVVVYEYEKTADAREPYLQRTSELAALDVGEETGVGAVSFQSPNIYGEGTGLFANMPMLVPIMFQYVLDHGYAFRMGDGTGHYGVVHVEDLADLYVLFVLHILEDGGKDLPSGKSGIVFPNAGMVLYTEVAQGCVDAAFRKGVLPKPDGPQAAEVRLVDAEEIAPYTGGGELGKHLAKLAWAGHWNTKGTVGFKLGWKPTHLREDFLSDKHFDSELEAMLAGRRPLNGSSVTGH